MPWSTINAVVNGVYTWEKYPNSYGKAINLTRKLRNDYDKMLEEYDVLILPTLNYVPKRHAHTDATPLADAMQWCEFRIPPLTNYAS
jgi:amidase